MRAAVLVLLTACGRFEFSPTSDATSSDSGLSLDATVFPDGVAAAACGATVLLQDTFDVSGAGPAFQAYATGSGVTTMEASGMLNVQIATAASADSYAGYYSTVSYTAEGLCVSVEMNPTLPTGGLSYLAIYNGTAKADFVLDDGMLNLKSHQGAQVAVVLEVPYNATAHRRWRLREQGGMMYWDVSTDGVAYVSLASTAFLSDPTLFVEIGAGVYAIAPSTGTATFDNALVTGP